MDGSVIMHEINSVLNRIPTPIREYVKRDVLTRIHDWINSGGYYSDSYVESQLEYVRLMYNSSVSSGYSTIYTIDGGDGIGKGALYDLINEEIPGSTDATYYRPNYDVIDPILNNERNKAFIVGLSIVDYMMSCSIHTLPPFIFDRQLPSSVAYDAVYNTSGVPSLSEDTLSSYLEYNKSINLNYMYLRHSSKESAKRIYEHNLSNKTLEELDIFDSFDEYWDKYLSLHEEFMNFYIDNKVNFTEYESVSNNDGSHVTVHIVKFHEFE